MGVSTVAGIVKDVSNAIWDTLQPIYMPIPSPSQWRDIAVGYANHWHFPHCCSAIDGKHYMINVPPYSGSTYFNYKYSFSLVLMALADLEYRFTMVDIGAAGSDGDSFVFHNSALGSKFMTDTLPIPPLQNLPGCTQMAPFVLVGNEAFPPKSNLLKPYPRRTLTIDHVTQCIFNYKLSCACMTVECVFGILSQQFHCLARKMYCTEETVEAVMKAVCVLHNYLLKEDGVA